MSFSRRMKEGDSFEGKVTIEAVYHRSSKGWMACQCSDRLHGKFGLTGNLGDDVSEGSFVEIEGVWRNNAKYGWQVAATDCELLTNDERSGFIKQLTRVSKVSPVLAEAIWYRFREESIEACLDLEQLMTIPGMNPVDARAIVSSMSDRILRERKSIVVSEMMMLGANGASSRRAFEDFGEASYDLLTVHPYTFGVVYGGLPFDHAGGLAELSPERPPETEIKKLAAKWGLMEAASESGHLYLPLSELSKSVSDRIPNMAENEISEMLESMAEKGFLVIEGDSVYDRDLHEAECVVASNLVVRQKSPVKVKKLEADVDAVIRKIEIQSGTEYTDEQRKAVESAVSNPVSLITGGPGTGKTTVCLGVIHALEDAGLSVALCSPTGRGAKRLSQVTERDASTIHRFLKFDPSTEAWGYGLLSPVDFIDAILVDETSMVDIPLARAIFDAWPAGTRIILVGDYDQLPSVGPGRFLKDSIEFGNPLAVSRLSKVFRHGGRSGIALAAASIKEGVLPELLPLEEGLEEGGFSWVEIPSSDDIVSVLPAMMDGFAEEFDLEPSEIQLIVPTNIGPLGTKALNPVLRDHFNPKRSRKAELENQEGVSYRVGDKVMQIRNDYNKEVFNGDIGKVVAVKNGLLIVEYEGISDSFEASYHPKEFEDLTLAYSLSCHKGQGSEFDAGVFLMHESHGRMLQRNLLYTAISRFRRGVVGCGTTSAMLKAVENDKEERRNTSLKERMETIAGSY